MSVPKLKMEGRSGCNLIIEYQEAHAVIKKYSSSLKYNHRLIEQAKKQKDFYLLNKESAFTTAKILEVSCVENELASFTMNYVFAEKYSEYLDQINVKELKKLLGSFIQYFDDSFKTASNEQINKNIFLDKFKDIRTNISQNQLIRSKYFLQILNDLENKIPNQPLPVGTCHGDFTFSNILFGEQKIYLLDFLDSFIESPVIDIVKLRQDTCYKWSIMLESTMPQYKVNKLSQIMVYFDLEIENYCAKLELQEWYIFLQAINLLRIVPYLKVEHEILFIENALRKLLK